MKQKFDINRFDNMPLTEERKRREKEFLEMMNALNNSTGPEAAAIARYLKLSADLMIRKLNLQVDGGTLSSKREEWYPKVERLVNSVLNPGKVMQWNEAELKLRKKIIYQLQDFENEFQKVSDAHEKLSIEIWDDKDSLNKRAHEIFSRLFNTRLNPAEFEGAKKEAEALQAKEEKQVIELERQMKVLNDNMLAQEKLYSSIMN